MPSYGYVPVQLVPLNTGAIFDTIVPCTKGLVLHENQTPFVILRGVPNCPCQRVARYKVTAISNIALPEGATVVPIAVGLTVMSAVRPDSIAISTPTAVGDFNNVTCSDIIDVPRGCCLFVGIANVPASSDAGYTPADTIDMRNLNITVEKLP